MDLGQPTHDDGQEEAEKSRNGCWQHTRHYGKRMRRSLEPLLQERDICSDLQNRCTSLRMIRNQDEAIVETYRIQVGQNRYNEKRGCIEKTNET